MNKIFELIHKFLGQVIDLALLPFRGLDPVWGLSAISVIAGLFFIYLYGLVSNQKAISDTKEKIYAAILESILYRHSVKLCLGAQARMLGLSGKYFFLALKPLFILSIPCLLLLAQLNLYYGVQPLKIGERTLVEVKLPEGSKASGLTLLAPPQLEIEAAVRSDSLNEATWRIRGLAEGQHEVTIRNMDTSVSEKRVLYVGPYTGPITSQSFRTWWGALLYPIRGPGLSSSLNSLTALSVSYGDKTIDFLGYHSNWIVVFLIVSMTAGLVGAKLFSVEI